MVPSKCGKVLVLYQFVNFFSIGSHAVFVLPTLRQQNFCSFNLSTSFFVSVSQISSRLLFCIAFHIVIAFLTIAIAIVDALLRSERRQLKLKDIFLLYPLRAIAANFSWKCDNFRESNREKELIPKMNQRRLKAITLQEALQKSPIMLSKYQKK